ncbi:MAG: amino acid adenylation domain-containing protein [Actinophytocola sp.]|uniref:amino acid adenylation domain-containing protein n=1 Tax=Actinophytocola sp. TaxID=1872138 RepID=UPI003C781EFF
MTGTPLSTQDTLLDRLAEWHRDRPDAVAYRLLGDGETETARLTYGLLHDEVVRVARHVRRRTVDSDRVALLYTPSLDFVAGFLGVLHAGRVAVPVAAPVAHGASTAGLAAILRDADVALVLTDFPDADVAEWLRGGWPAEQVRDLGDDAGPADEDRPVPAPEDLALLQYTSGSTGSPRGVMVSHHNLMANQEQIREAFGQGGDAVVVSWLPFFHDMGLIGGVLHSLYLGATAVLMPPETVLREPARWLRAISRYRGTVSPAPNFGYDQCVRRVSADQLPGLDLSSWQVACNGSEPVNPRVLAAFAETFAPSGFRAESLVPCYGLAEATLLVSASAGRPPRVEPHVSCGAAVTDVVVVLDGAAVPDGTEGELWVHGPNVAGGYWRNPAATEETFRAALPGDPRTFLRTGDLGYTRDGEVFVTGRVKDLLIIRGRNHHPQDVEATVQAVEPRLVPGAGAAFTTDDDRLVVVQAARGTVPDPDGLTDRIRQAVAREHGLAVSEVVLVKPAGVPRTTSGKVRRAACRDRYVAGELTSNPRESTVQNPRVHGSEPASPRFRTRESTVRDPELPVVVLGGPGAATAADDDPSAVAELVAEVLGVPAGSLADDRPLSASGLDSLRAMHIQQILAEAGRTVPGLDALLGGATLRDITALPPAEAPPRATGPWEVTRGQQALWFLSQWNEGSAAAYVLARAVELTPEPDEDRLRTATMALVARHGQLRSRFRHDGDRVVRAEWGVADHAWFTARDVESGSDLAAAISAEAAKPVDLAEDPLFRLVLFRRTGHRPVLLIVASHLVSDLHSLAVVRAELGALYEGTPLPPAPDVATVVASEQAYLASEEGQAALAAWAGELRDAPVLDLPRDRERGTGTRFLGDATTLRFDARDGAALDRLAAELGTTPYTVLLAAYHGFLDRICGQGDIVVGVPVALRSGSRLAGAVGYLINTVPVRIHADGGGDSLVDRVACSRDALVTVLARARVPLPSLVEQLGVGADPSPLFQVSCGFYDDGAPGQHGVAGLALEVEAAEAAIGSLAARSWPLPVRTAVTELDVTFGRTGDGLVVRVNHSTEVFDPVTAHHLAESLRTFVSAALGAPREPLRDLPTWHGPGSVLLPGDVEVGTASLAARFAEQVRTVPAAPAVVHGDRTWSYAELGAWTARLAAALPPAPRDGTTPVAALFFEGGPRFVAGMVAALRAGYAFLPLMPDLPDERLRFMLADAGVAAVFAAQEDVGRIAALAAGAEVALDVLPVGEEPEQSCEQSDVDIAARLAVRDGNAVAYVVYTSGTTGRPKGVVITDDSVLPLLCWQAREFPAGPGMRMAQTCALSFDVGLQELLTVLVFGGAICMPLPGERYSAAGFGGFLARDRANALYATPTFIRELTARDTPMHTIEVVQIAGEMLTSTVVERVRPLFAPGCRVFNGYGPTETSINCAMYLTAPDTAPEGAALPVGTPTGLARLYVLDRYRRPLPPALYGEVYIGGPGVGAGYVNRPEETAARFLPDTVLGHGRMYRTGDRGRVLPDGRLVITGRLDDQVKIRGYRIEPGEVEAQLRPLVTDCAVIVAQGANGPRLLAYVTGAADAVELRVALAERLPGYMMPARIVVLDTLPRTRNGKLDTRALLAAADRPDTSSRAAGRLLPVVVGIWREVLGLHEFDVDANFFEIGGSSLLLARVAASVRDATTIDVSVPKLFQYPTARSLSAYLETVRADPMDTTGRTPSLGTARRVRGRQRRG